MNKKVSPQQIETLQKTTFIQPAQTPKPAAIAKIGATLLSLKSKKLDKGTVKLINYRLCELSAKNNLSNPQEIEDYIDNKKKKNGKPASDEYKNCLLKAYKKANRNKTK